MMAGDASPTQKGMKNARRRVGALGRSRDGPGGLHYCGGCVAGVADAVRDAGNVVWQWHTLVRAWPPYSGCRSVPTVGNGRRRH